MEIKEVYLNGNCPVQAEGTIDGHKYYFRGRGDSLEMMISTTDTDPIDSYFDHPEDDDVFIYQERYGKRPDAGYISEEHARAFMNRAFQVFINRGTSEVLIRSAPSEREYPHIYVPEKERYDINANPH